MEEDHELQLSESRQEMMTAVATAADEEMDVGRADANLWMLLALLRREVASGPGDVVGHQPGKEDLNKKVQTYWLSYLMPVPRPTCILCLKLPQ